MPVGGVGTPLGDVGVVVVLVEMGDDEVDGFVVGVVEQTVQQSVRVEPVIEYDYTVLLLGSETGVVDVVELHGQGAMVRVWGRSQSSPNARRNGHL